MELDNSYNLAQWNNWFDSCTKNFSSFGRAIYWIFIECEDDAYEKSINFDARKSLWFFVIFDVE